MKFTAKIMGKKFEPPKEWKPDARLLKCGALFRRPPPQFPASRHEGKVYWSVNK